MVDLAGRTANYEGDLPLAPGRYQIVQFVEAIRSPIPNSNLPGVISEEDFLQSIAKHPLGMSALQSPFNRLFGHFPRPIADVKLTLDEVDVAPNQTLKIEIRWPGLPDPLTEEAVGAISQWTADDFEVVVTPVVEE
jgi:hypothetical protein